MKSRIVLVLCGSFNPITHLHLRMFERARDILQQTGKYKVEGGIISPVHDAYGKKGLAEAKHRVAMCDLAVQTSEWIRVDHWESQQDGWKRTRETLAYLQGKVSAEYKDQDVTVKMLCGADLLESFSKPGLWASEDIVEFVSKYGLAVISRNGYNAQVFVESRDELCARKENIHIIPEVIYNDVSATKIRLSISKGESVKYLIPDSVIEYIRQHNLYQNSEDEGLPSIPNCVL
ncbi:hypothetical protein EMCRGX_G029117 [Ephydatia muelleri]|eukprot:Em0013g691a